MANTNIQFYTDTRKVFATSDGNGKTAIGSADATVQGFEIEYNLGVTGANEAFKISPLGINYTLGPTGATGSINYTTLLPRIAQVGSLLQAVETPPDATTLQVDKKILLTDGVYNGSIGISGVNAQIDASGDLILDPVGLIDLSGNTLDMTNGQISNCSLLQGVNDTNITVEALGTGNVILKTGGVDRIDVRNSGRIDFEGGMTYNNSNDTLTATNFNGSVPLPNVTNSVNTDNALVTEDNTNGNYKITLAKLDVTGQQPLFADTGDPNTYNPSTGVFEFSIPPTCGVAATSVNDLVNFNNFNSVSFTPTLESSGGGTASYNIRTGARIKIGNICFLQVDIEVNDISGLNPGGLRITLPFSGVNASSGVVGSFGGLGVDAAEVSCSTSRTVVTSLALGIRKTLSSAPASLMVTDITSSFKIRAGFCYFVAF